MSDVSVPCLNCHTGDRGPCCHGCWDILTEQAKDELKLDYNKNVRRGDYGSEAQFHCEIPGCWGTVRKIMAKKGDYRCWKHYETAIPERSRSRSPVPRRSDVASASNRVILPLLQVREAMASFRDGLDVIWNAMQQLEQQINYAAAN